jgi:N-dimethylarginine dimethylaminohydrolase
VPEPRHSFGVHSEYGRLREVIVGRPDELFFPPWSKEFSHYNAEFTAALQGRQEPLGIEQAMSERFARLQEQTDHLVATYERYGVVVHRPRLYTEVEKRYLAELQQGHSQLYPADPVFVLGKHFLELNVRRAYRRKEVFPLRDAVAELIAKDPDAHHVAIPATQPNLPPAEGAGPYLEGGDILICGRDVIVGQHELCSDRGGIRWLARYLAPHGYQVHPMPLQGSLLHGLGVMCLIREGLLLAYRPALVEGLPSPVKDWEVIDLSADEARNFATVGVSIDEKTHLIGDTNTRVIDELDKRGVEPIPMPAEDIGFFGGSLRCSTLPISRDA